MHSGIYEALETEGPMVSYQLEQYCRQRRTDFRRRLRTLVELGAIVRRGSGIPGDPFIYSIPGDTREWVRPPSLWELALQMIDREQQQKGTVCSPERATSGTPRKAQG